MSVYITHLGIDNWNIEQAFAWSVNEHIPKVSKVDLHVKEVAESHFFAGVEPPSIEKNHNMIHWDSPVDKTIIDIELGYIF